MSRSPPPTAELLAEAAARRLANADSDASPAALLVQEHDKRQEFRRLIDRGVFRPNSKEVAISSLKTLSTIAENILRDPENPKYQTLKRENDVIKHRLIEPKGALEYALALGFQPRVRDFQSYYVFLPSRMADLRIGAAILRETLDREIGKEERLQRDKEQQKAAEAAVAQSVKLAFIDDRVRKRVRDQRERETREARQSVRANVSSPLPPEGGSPVPMPGPGYTLAASTSVDQVLETGLDEPPPYAG